VSENNRLTAVLHAFGPSDVSCLVALRALATLAGVGGTLAVDDLLEGMEAEYRRVYPSPATADGDPAAAGEMSRFPAPATLDYLREHVLPRLAEQGAAESHSNGSSGVVWLTPWLTEARANDPAGVVSSVDARITELLAASTPALSPQLPTRRGSTLRAEGLVKIYRKRRVVNEVAVEVSEGEIVGLLGPNGAGKTTTFYMMVGLIAPDRGRVLLDSENVTKVPMYRRARRGIGYLAQEPSVFRRLTVEENVLAILQMLRVPKRERHERLERYLDELSIKHLRSTRAYALSGGERRRLEITRALVSEPKFMLLDEPFAGVDPIAVHDIQQIVADLRRRGIGVLISDHNVEQTLDIVDRAYIMYEGRVRISGTVSELVWNDEAAEIYLGPTLTARMRSRYPRPA
jgi:lipopolysaccharide export system ATP-binding protein